MKRTNEEKMRHTAILNIIKFICILVMTAYCFFNEWLLDHVGGLICIVAIAFMLTPRNLINWSLDNLDEQNNNTLNLRGRLWGRHYNIKPFDTDQTLHWVDHINKKLFNLDHPEEGGQSIIKYTKGCRDTSYPNHNKEFSV